MDNPSRPKIWVTAGPFGFGPAAMAFNLFPQLQKLRTKETGQTPLLEYVGCGHAMDFNASLPWDSVHDINVHEANGKDALAALYLSEPPFLTISVLDQPFVEAIIPHGAKTALIDSIFWYWESVWPIYKNVTIILMPELVGVRERVAEFGLTNAVLLPGMLPIGHKRTLDPAEVPLERKGTLINLGGLQTPFTAVSENIKYTRSILHAIQLAVGQHNNARDQPLTAIVSAKVAHALKPGFPFIETVDPATARQRLRECRTAFMTSGMGNIFDAVDLAERLAFLPAICKSHGLQLELISELGARPVVIDWEDVVPQQARLDYHTDEQSGFEQVEAAMARYLASSEAEENMVKMCLDVLEGEGENVSSLQRIPEAVGRGDESVFVRAIAEADLGFTLAN